MEEKMPGWAKTLIENQKVLSEAIIKLSGKKEEKAEDKKEDEQNEDEASAEECEKMFGDIRL